MSTVCLESINSNELIEFTAAVAAVAPVAISTVCLESINSNESIELSAPPIDDCNAVMSTVALESVSYTHLTLPTKA